MTSHLSFTFRWRHPHPGASISVMARTLAILAASSWLTLAGEADAGTEPGPERTDPPSESAEAPASTAERPDAADSSAATSELAPAKSAEDDQVPAVKEVILDPTTKPPVCQRYVPTGSRIATERCHSAEVGDAARAAERDQMRRDIDELRMRQATRDAARDAAQAEALRRRMGF
jgi:hypothetical protein